MTRTRVVAFSLAAFGALLIPRPAQAAVDRLCRVSAATVGSSSSGSVAQVRVYVGRELPVQARPIDFVPSAVYAEIRFADGQVALLQYQSNVRDLGAEFGSHDFTKLFAVDGAKQFRQVNGARGRIWNITGRDSSRFIDPRAEGDR
jgi:hypothetical protein